MVPRTSSNTSSSRYQARICLLTTIAASFVLLMATSARAENDHVILVRVQVRFDLETLTKVWQTRQSQIEAELGHLLTRHLAKAYPYWHFAPSSSRPGMDLEFRLFDKNREIFLQVAVRDDDEMLGKPLLEVLYGPNQHGKLGALAKRPLAFAQIVRETLRIESADDNPLFKLMMECVPVTTTGQWRIAPRGVPSVVLPLPWEPNFKRLGMSHFRLLGERADYPLYWFEAAASPHPGRYPVKPGPQKISYEALQVFPSLKTSSQDPTRYRPRGIYLAKYVPWMVSMMKNASAPETSP